MNRLTALILNRTLLAIVAAILAAVAAVTYQGQAVLNLNTGISDGNPSKDENFDYVIIGGGTAGLALAARLAEGSSHNIAVIEAGGFYEQDDGNLSVVPGYCTFYAGTEPDNFNPLTDWGFVTRPQKVSHGRFTDPFGTWVQPAVETLGLKPINRFQSGQLIGSGYLPYTVDAEKAHRSSSASSFLQSVHDKPSLRVYHRTLAEKILLDESYTANGVVVSSNGHEYTLRANKEVIVSAGTFQSPQLLMLSGVGPRSTLEAFNIPVHVDLPGVGKNLQDHPLFGSQYRVNVPTVSAALNSPFLLAVAQEAYEVHAAGPLTIPASGFLGWEKLPERYRKNLTASSRKTLDTSFPVDWPELEYIPISAAMGYQRNYQKEDPLDSFNYATIAASLVAPLSRGTVTIASPRAVDLPIIDPNFLAHPADAELAIAAVHRQREIWKALDGLTVGDEWLPGPAATSDEDILKFVKESVAPAWHAASTCKMGKREDRMAVVDSEARVFGTKGLRVVDASAFPFLVPGHPQATIYALAEKIAEGILEGKGAE
ncbi:MAG: hypothetical protein Q9217_003630 [Psora testacea]